MTIFIANLHKSRSEEDLLRVLPSASFLKLLDKPLNNETDLAQFIPVEFSVAAYRFGRSQLLSKRKRFSIRSRLELFYVTDRNKIQPAIADQQYPDDPDMKVLKNEIYGNDRGDYPLGYEMGRCWVSIPRDHVFGKLERPYTF